MRTLWLLPGLLCAPLAGLAAEAPADPNELHIDIEVIAKRLDLARQQIQPALGATVYNFSPAALQNVPQGENAPLDQVLLQAPGVAQDSFGQIHLRGEHANVQYRLNGVELPEGLSVFGQALTERFARSLSLITGALPAQYGFQTAGVVDIQTKTGLTDPGLTVSMYGGSWNWLEPSLEYGGHTGPVDYFFALDGLHNQRGIENPTPDYAAIHDTTNQFHGLAYMSGILDPDTRVSLILGGFDGSFQIPNNPGQTPPGGMSTFNSADLNELQNEVTLFSVLSLQKHVDQGDLQVSLFNRTSTLSFSPTGSAICCSTASRKAPPGRMWRPAFSRTPVGRSTNNTRCGWVFWRRSSTPLQQRPRACCRWMRAACRPPTCRSASSTTGTVRVACMGFMFRMNGR